MYNRFFILDANIGDVLYRRISGCVQAIKLVKIVCGDVRQRACSDDVHAWFLVAGEGDEPQMVYVGWHNKTKFYRSIEDCINDVNPVERKIVSAKDIASYCNMDAEDMVTSFGMSYYGVRKFKWDGYMPKMVDVSLGEFLFVRDKDGWHSEVVCHSYEAEPKKYYDTYEECIADNRVKVIVF